MLSLLPSHAPSHGTREVLIVYGALLSSDPGDIHDTIASLVADRIQVSIIGLAAQVAICSEISARTHGGDDGAYAVALDEPHCRELLLVATTPPLTREGDAATTTASLLMMGFPSRVAAGALSACACHGAPSREGYLCTRCGAKVCRLPSECPACGLVLILSTHLARSYHHLFPLQTWGEVSWQEASASAASPCCFACLAPFPTRAERGGEGQEVPRGVSESGRYACGVCGNHFCIDCDVYAHEVLHNCPGCQSADAADGKENGHETNVGMVIDG
jgi:transcription initiation factor TFIIH subunit 2